MAGSADQRSFQDLLGIFQAPFFGDPSYARREDYELSPIRTMLGQSPALDMLRQYLPNRAGDTKAVQWLNEQLPADENPKSFAEKLKRGIASVPLGGYSAQELAELDTKRAVDPVAEAYTTRRGVVPGPDGPVPVGDSFRAAAAQNLGVISADGAIDGARNIWWFLNAPQALAAVATLQALHRGGKDFVDPTDGGQFLRNRNLRLAATLPAMLGMSMAVGNVGRQPGYTAAVPSEADKTQTADPLAEAGARYFLGRTGSLMPYDEFVKERPDVSKGEYEAYKAYLHGNSLPLKATFDGINGPEVTFMGKSIPVLTGVLPAVAAIAGTAYGVRKAGRRLLQVKEGEAMSPAAKERSLLDTAWQAGRHENDERAPSEISYNQRVGELRRRMEELGQAAKAPTGTDGQPDQEAVQRFAELKQLYRNYDKQYRANQGDILGQSLLYSASGLTGAALAGQTLELIRRSLKGDVAAEPEPVAPASAPVAAAPVTARVSP